MPTNIVTDYKPYCSSGSYSGTHDPKYKGASRKGGSAKSRSLTFIGIAEAMASQWSETMAEQWGGDIRLSTSEYRPRQERRPCHSERGGSPDVPV